MSAVATSATDSITELAQAASVSTASVFRACEIFEAFIDAAGTTESYAGLLDRMHRLHLSDRHIATTVCAYCGETIYQRTHHPGRPKRFCDSDCRVAWMVNKP